MRLTFLGKETVNGGSPTLYRTDRNTYVAQGYKVAGTTRTVEIWKGLFNYLPGGVRLDTEVIDTGKSYLISGEPVTDTEALAQMDLPDNESAVEIGWTVEDGNDGALEG